MAGVAVGLARVDPHRRVAAYGISAAAGHGKVCGVATATMRARVASRAVLGAMTEVVYGHAGRDVSDKQRVGEPVN
jgi:hypothetical protein